MFQRAAGRAGRLLRSLIDPDGPRRDAAVMALGKQAEDIARQLAHQREALTRLREDFVSTHRDDLKSLQREVAKQRDSLRDVQTRVERLHDDGLGTVHARFGLLRASVDRQSKLFSKAMTRAEGLSRWILDEQHTLERLGRLARSDRPIVVGPWTGEVGFELLYWAPFVRWAVGHFGIDPDRLLIVSRGGTASWYGMPAEYEDVLRMCGLDEFRAGSEAVKKQRLFSALDRTVIRRLMARGGIRPKLLHPSLMYQLFWPFWREELTYRHVLRYTHQRLLTPPDHPVVAQLPRDYVAVRFYFSSCFPDTPDNRGLVAAVVRHLAEKHEVVLLNSGLRLDDHEEFRSAVGRRVHFVSAHDQPDANLTLQTAVIARARQFVGTYGGFSYLAPYLGVDSLAFYSIRNFRAYHLELAQRLFEQIGGGSLIPLDAAKVPLVGDALAAAVPLGTGSAD